MQLLCEKQPGSSSVGHHFVIRRYGKPLQKEISQLSVIRNPGDVSIANDEHIVYPKWRHRDYLDRVPWITQQEEVTSIEDPAKILALKVFEFEPLAHSDAAKGTQMVLNALTRLLLALTLPARIGRDTQESYESDTPICSPIC